jgi:DNA (cytosine-5)-methyltransferase 1
MGDPLFRWNAVEICAGGGGMSTGIRQAGFRVRAAAELDADQAAVFARNHPETALLQGAAGDIRRLSGASLLKAAGLPKGELDLLAGGIPCQGFSSNGKRRLADPRNSLWTHVPRLARETGARMVVVENVPGMLSLGKGKFVDGLKSGLEKEGYSVSVLKVDAADYGVPQHRKRLFIVGAPDQIELPSVTLPRVSVWEALRDLPEGPSDDPQVAAGLPYVTSPSVFARGLRGNREAVKDCGTVNHADFLVERFRKLKAGERDEPTRHRRLHAKRPSYTMLAGAKTITACRPVHPYRHRVLTVREGARLFGYPDDYSFAPTVQKSWYALGNSVPPPLARSMFTYFARTLA